MMIESGYVVQMKYNDRWLTYWYTTASSRKVAIAKWSATWENWDWVKERRAKNVRCVKCSVSLEK